MGKIVLKYSLAFALLQSSCIKYFVSFRLFYQTPVIEIPSFNQNYKVTCDICGTQTTLLNFVRHKKRCSVGRLYCTHCPNFSRKKKQIDLIYHIAKKHSAPKRDVTFNCKHCYQEF